MSNFNQWSEKFKQQSNLVLSASLSIIDKAADEFKTRVEQRTPVGDPSLWNWPARADYKPGTLRASWVRQDSYNGISKIITIENHVPYGPRVEYQSWSTQAPHGMMRVTALEWPDIINKVSNTNKK